jgi:hypothetical protein
MSTLSNTAGAWGLTQDQFMKSLYSDGTYAGVIVATTTAQSNGTTAAPFTMNPGSLITLQADAACYVEGQTTSAGTAATTDTLVAANTPFTLLLKPDQAFVSVKAVGGTVNCQVRVKAG